MAVETEFHLQRCGLIHQRHLIDRAVAIVAAYSLIDVNAVIEIDKIRKLVHAHPLQRFSAAVALANGLKIGRIGPDLGVAVDAGLRRRNSGKTGLLDRRMAIAAIDSEPGHVMLMAERNRLIFALPCLRDVGRPLQLEQHK